MILNSATYNSREENARRQALRKMSVATSIKRFIELIQAGWFMVKQQQHPMPLSMAKLISAKP